MPHLYSGTLDAASDMSYLNQGGLWRNKMKRNNKDPDFIGSININGVEHKVVAWRSSSPHKQAPLINIKLSDPAPVPMAQPVEKKDDIPF